METPCWCISVVWPENTVNIWKLPLLSRRLIVCTEQTNIYTSTFPNDLTSKKAKNHEAGIYFKFSTNAIAALGQAHAITLKFKIRWFSSEAHY